MRFFFLYFVLTTFLSGVFCFFEIFDFFWDPFLGLTCFRFSLCVDEKPNMRGAIFVTKRVLGVLDFFVCGVCGGGDDLVVCE